MQATNPVDDCIFMEQMIITGLVIVGLGLATMAVFIPVFGISISLLGIALILAARMVQVDYLHHQTMRELRIARGQRKTAIEQQITAENQRKALASISLQQAEGSNEPSTLEQ